MTWSRNIYWIYSFQTFSTKYRGGGGVSAIAPRVILKLPRQKGAEYHRFRIRLKVSRGSVAQLIVISLMFDSRCRQQLACVFFICPSIILTNITGLCQVYAGILNWNSKHWKMFWPKVNEFLISMVYAGQIQQMGSVSKHPLWPGGFSCSCTGATHKHTNELLTEIKHNREQSGFNLG